MVEIIFVQVDLLEAWYIARLYTEIKLESQSWPWGRDLR